MRFSQLSATLAQIETINSRLEITAILATLWEQLDDQEAWEVANLIQGRLRPPYEQLVFNLSEKMVARALTHLALAQGGLAGGVSVDLFGQPDEETLTDQIKKIHRRWGDWGATAADVHTQLFGDAASDCSIDEVYQALVHIAELAGDGSQQAKLDALIALLRRTDATSSKIIVRMVIGKLRLGFATMTILDSLSWAVCADKSESKLLENVWQKKADVGLLARTYLKLKNLSPPQRAERLQTDYHASVGVPLVPALCQRLSSSIDIIEKVGPVIAEPKYDGMRVQIHLRRDGDRMKIGAFTRSLEDVSQMFPELHTLAATLHVHDVIFDSEAVGFNAQTGAMLPFQETISRRRIHDVDEKSQSIRMKFFIFDILVLDGEELLNVPLLRRKEILRATLTDSDVAVMTTYMTTNDPDELRAYHQAQLQAGLEGMVAKGQQTAYQSGRKGWQWVKIKEAEGTRGKLNDTLDLVVMGYYYGQGRRHEMGIGAVLAGVSDGHGGFVTISKIGSGFTDDNLRQLRDWAQKLAVEKMPPTYHVDKTLIPDVWFEPQLVGEIAADELTHSSMHTSGYGLRFPRIIQWRRDKTGEQATTTAELSGIAIDTGEKS